MNVLTNIWMSAGGNDVYCADIYFSDRIEKIVPRDNKVYQWEEAFKGDGLRNLYEERKADEFPKAVNVYNGKFMLAVPGGVDGHVHFNTPGFEEREDFEHGSSAAIAGGTTTVIDMPCTSLPPVTSGKNLRHKLDALHGRSYCDFALWGGINGLDVADGSRLKKRLAELTALGVVGFKAYFISGMETFTDLSFEEMLKAAHLVKETGLLLAVHAEKKETVLNKRNRFKAEGRHGWRDYCEARNFVAEGEAVEELKNIARITECPVHVVHLSSSFGLDTIASARNEGIELTAETCPHYLHFTENDFENPSIAAFLKTAPPVKTLHDRESLWRGLSDGTLSFVTTDHAGCDPAKEKISDNFWEVYGGIPGVEHRVPYLFSEGFLQGRLTLEQTIKLLSANPARFYGLKNKGELNQGKDADIVLMDFHVREIVTATAMHSKGKYTPFEGLELRASAKEVFLRGERVKKSNVLTLSSPNGKFIPSRKVT